jgi:hypothetical protein
MRKNISQKPGNFLVNTAITILSIALALVAGEMFVRTWLPSPDYGVGKRPATRNKLFMHDELLGWKGSPNTSSPYISKDFQVTVTNDALGYRNQSSPYIAGKKNYLLLGDSYAWGWGVEDNETAASVLNRKHEEYNTYNLGVPGYGTDQEYLAMQRLNAEHPDLKYDGVVLLFYLNDFENIISRESHLYAKPAFILDASGKLQLQNVPVPKNNIPPFSITDKPPEQSFLEHSQLANIVGYSILSIYFAMTSGPDPEAGKPVVINQQQKDSITLATAIIADLKRYCTEKNMEFHVVFLITVNTDQLPATMIAALAKNLNQQNINHSYFYSRTFPRTDLWLDTHYTPYGQSLLADHISEIISPK